MTKMATLMLCRLGRGCAMCRVDILDSLSEVSSTIKGVTAILVDIREASGAGSYIYEPDKFALLEKILFDSVEKIERIEKRV